MDKFAAHVGLDWADKKHDVCVQFKNGERIFHVIEHTPEALDIWLNELHQKVKGRIAIALELKKGPVVYALQKYPFVTVFPVHSLSLARYRQTFWPSGAKDDPQDADFVIHYIDLWSHAVIGWSMSARMTAQLACDALKMALWRRKRPENVIVH
ncbi:IS110 family transposase, partial [Yersinia ruckeri]|uniref:IS110 family transposase n=3 Tax=Yersinia ruckeri TaxID=29486 RepID=UPI003B75BB83